MPIPVEHEQACLARNSAKHSQKREPQVRADFVRKILECQIENLSDISMLTKKTTPRVRGVVRLTHGKRLQHRLRADLDAQRGRRPNEMQKVPVTRMIIDDVQCMLPLDLGVVAPRNEVALLQRADGRRAPRHKLIATHLLPISLIVQLAECLVIQNRKIHQRRQGGQFMIAARYGRDAEEMTNVVSRTAVPNELVSLQMLIWRVVHNLGQIFEDGCDLDGEGIDGLRDASRGHDQHLVVARQAMEGDDDLHRQPINTTLGKTQKGRNRMPNLSERR